MRAAIAEADEGVGVIEDCGHGLFIDVRGSLQEDRLEVFLSDQIQEGIEDAPVLRRVPATTSPVSAWGTLLSLSHAFGCVKGRHQVHGFGMQRIFSQAGLGELDGVRAASSYCTVDQGFRVYCG
jgi:hypothetical protein